MDGEAVMIDTGLTDFSYLNNSSPEIISEEDLMRSAVAIALTDDDEVILEVRSEKIAHQPGDICLPGGKVENDETPKQAVIRELTEELLVDGSQVHMIAPSHIFVAGSLEIYSFLCRVSGYHDTFGKDEVESILRIPLSFFLSTEPEIHEVEWHPDLTEDFPFDKIHGGRGYVWRKHKSRIRFYEYEGHVIWGITARIMEAFAKQLLNK